IGMAYLAASTWRLFRSRSILRSLVPTISAKLHTALHFVSPSSIFVVRVDTSIGPPIMFSIWVLSVSNVLLDPRNGLVALRDRFLKHFINCHQSDIVCESDCTDAQKGASPCDAVLLDSLVGIIK
ncbi:hypothetical protein ACLKA6_016276, partial [Drosophila palustris]